jgi:nucleoside-diphosphate-sugar epimerase
MDSYFRSFDLPVVTLRPFNTYGPRQSLRAVIPTIIAQLLSGQTTLQLGNVTPTRDFNFVEDTVNAFITLAELHNDSILGQTFNAGSGKEITVENLVKLIADIIGTTVKIQTDDSRIRPSLSEVERLQCNADKLKSLSKWQSKIDLEKGLSITTDWMKHSLKKDRSRSYQL